MCTWSSAQALRCCCHSGHIRPRSKVKANLQGGCATCSYACTFSTSPFPFMGLAGLALVSRTLAPCAWCDYRKPQSPQRPPPPSLSSNSLRYNTLHKSMYISSNIMYIQRRCIRTHFCPKHKSGRWRICLFPGSLRVSAVAVLDSKQLMTFYSGNAAAANSHRVIQ